MRRVRCTTRAPSTAPTTNTPGLKTDCETLLGRFQETDSVRFEVFTTIWKDMKFSTIFHGKMGKLEKNKFTREALSTASQYFFPPFTFQIRVGALYLLYGLYNTQHCQPKQMIRIALKDWHEVLTFQQDLINAQHFDAAYILRKLRLHRAFHFTAMPKFLTYRTNRKLVLDVVKEEFKESKDRVTELITSDMLEEMLNVQEHYQKMKCAISSTKSQPDKALSLIKEGFVLDLKSIAMDHQSNIQYKKKPSLKIKKDGDVIEDQETTSQESEGWERAKALAAIKSKSYSSAVQAPKSRRHRQVKVESSESGSDHGKKRESRDKRIRKRLHPRWRNPSVEGTVAEESLSGTLSMPVIIEEDSSSEKEAPCAKKKKRQGKALKKR